MSVSRIVSCTPSTTDILMLFGLAEQLVGVDEQSLNQNPTLRVEGLGPVDNLNVPRILELKPDLVVAVSTVPGAEASIDWLRDEGVNVLSLSTERFDDLLADIYTIGVECELESMARELVAELNERIKRLCSFVRLTDEPLRVYVELWPNPFVTAGHESWLTDILRKAGAVNIFSDVPESSFMVEEDEILEREPEAIFLSWAGYGDDLDASDLDSVLNRLRWKNLAAIQRKQVHLLPNSLFSFPGPRLIEGLELVIELVAASAERR